MARDPIANYVVSKAIEVSEGEQKKRLVALLASDRAVLVGAAYHFSSFCKHPHSNAIPCLPVH